MLDEGKSDLVIAAKGGRWAQWHGCYAEQR
jgi:hypothetical protein